MVVPATAKWDDMVHIGFVVRVLPGRVGRSIYAALLALPAVPLKDLTRRNVKYSKGIHHRATAARLLSEQKLRAARTLAKTPLAPMRPSQKLGAAFCAFLLWPSGLKTVGCQTLREPLRFNRSAVAPL